MPFWTTPQVPPAITTIMQSKELKLALLSLVLVIVGGLLRRRLGFLGGSLRLVGQLGLLIALLATAAQFLDFPMSLSAGGADTPAQTTTGTETRVHMGQDGHFWVQVRANGAVRRLLVDTGATLTTLSGEAADDFGTIPDADGSRITLTTANGITQAELGVIPSMRVGNVIVRHLTVAVSPAMAETNVLGMNFLSQLASWRVEGHTLILVPHHPQVNQPAAT
ncbi:MAG: TIGR02281 family clan AA aspartic protease [Pseudomonadota bacterium]|nr:TIGR02281 family clan AA aspartic protease [Pseudomonadota bacterium]